MRCNMKSTPSYKLYACLEECLCLKPGKTGIILHEEFSTISQDQRSTLHFNLFVFQENPMGGCVMLHFMARVKAILPNSFKGRSKTCPLNSVLKCSIANVNVILFFQDFFNTNRIKEILKE